MPPRKPILIIDNTFATEQAQRKELEHTFVRLTRPLPARPALLMVLALASLLLGLGLWMRSLPVVIGLGLGVLAAGLTALFIELTRRERGQQLWDLLNASPDNFELGIPHIFRLRGFKAEATKLHRGGINAERTGDTGVFIKLNRDRHPYLAYCIPALLVITSVDVDTCMRTMTQYQIKRGLLVTRSSASAGAWTAARLANIEIVESTELRRTWLTGSGESSSLATLVKLIVASGLGLLLGLIIWAAGLTLNNFNLIPTPTPSPTAVPATETSTPEPTLATIEMALTDLAATVQVQTATAAP